MKAPTGFAEALIESPGPNQASDVQPLPPGAARFTYAGGSRPLAGYTIKRAVGRGGFGEVYYALSDGGKEVALKLVRRSLDVELRGVAQCLNLKHPNLLGLFDIRTDEHGDHWVVMEYIGGPSLEDVIAAHPNGMPAADAVAWLRGVASGVAYLHECGIVHRDLKPANVFCDAGIIKLGDYGLSKFISCSRRSGQTESIGTVHYMAPEIASGRYGREIDIYGLGIILYEMLTGRVPFEGESVAEVLMKHLTAPPDLSGVVQPYRSILTRALAKDPAERFTSVTELVAALPELKGATLQSPVIAQPLPRVEVARDAAVRQEPKMHATAPAKLSLREMAAEEPVLRFARRSLADFGSAWKERFSTPMKFVIILASLWAVIALGAPLVPLTIVIGFFYAAYFTAWIVFRSVSQNQGSTPVQVVPVAQVVAAALPTHAAYPAATTRRQRWHGKVRSALIVKPVRQRLAELCGSMVVSALAALVITLVMFLIRGEQAAPEQFAWVALVSIAGAWGILIPSKLWEGTDGETALRRFTMLIVGLLLGVVAWQTQQALTVALPHEFTAAPVAASANAAVVKDGPASVMTYLTYFGFLFLLVRWWRLADPLRSSRLGLWATLVCISCAIALYMLWPFPQRWEVLPQPWGFLVTAVMAIAVQLASPWQGKVKREK